MKLLLSLSWNAILRINMKYFPRLHRLPFLFVDGFHCSAENFESLTCLFVLLVSNWKSPLLRLISSLPTLCSSRSFWLCLTFNLSVIHFEFCVCVCVFDVRQGFSLAYSYQVFLTPEGNGKPTPVFLPGESHGQRRLMGYSPWSCKSWTRLHN